MTFDELLSLVKQDEFNGKVCADSRKVDNGDVFVAVTGANEDGHSFIANAIENGAKYIVCKSGYETDKATVLTASSPSKALGVLAHASYGNPSAKLINLGVTGTNGKTTVAYLVRSILKTAGEKCGLIGTIEYDTGSGVSEAMLTTPAAADIARLCNEMVRAGAKYMVTEASSHALAQDRLETVEFKAAAFTNLTGDHRDYHKTEENYLAAKRLLFENLSENATAITNAQSPFGKKIVEQTKAIVLYYAIDEDADITAAIESIDTESCVYDLKYNGKNAKVTTKLLGKHNISNQLAATGLCIAAGIDLETIAKGLGALETVPGRLEPVECGQNFKVLIDYAHTDDALQNVLDTLRQICRGKLIVVFGCGGDRDKSKRPRMAKVAQEKADLIFLTSDNPRTEDPKEIISDVLTGFNDPYAENITIISDRTKAIELSIRSAGAGDIVLIAGKGHETYQVIGNKKTDFDDSEVARKVLRALK
ncbi:MAG: UDP-N-acetylmuramoyl-L-alanyl-D-glutamate--2,6-diaminopimelate ligase [Planctomycetes bacterium]|nr:UDP-N-acetylmuramoyl-L-alanyl-D-glutamate--2,6-diaminopimelate ligase [Planctomycetota bacterium]